MQLGSYAQRKNVPRNFHESQNEAFRVTNDAVCVLIIMASANAQQSDFLSRFKQVFERHVHVLQTPDVGVDSIDQVIEGYAL